MQSDAIYNLFAQRGLHRTSSSQSMTAHFAEHVAARYAELSPGEFAFLLRVGGELVLRDIEKEWDANGVSDAAAGAVSKHLSIAIAQASVAPKPPPAIDTFTIRFDDHPRLGKQIFRHQGANEDFFDNMCLALGQVHRRSSRKRRERLTPRVSRTEVLPHSISCR